MIEAPARPALEIGETFGRYRIIKLLGAGGMGQVYHAWDEELGEAVALKVTRSEFATSADADARFRRELSVARQVTHTNVVRIHDLGLVDGVRYISMAFIDGLDLATMFAGGRLPQDLSLSIARQLCAGLAAAHQAGVVHRDLKPANVMVDRSGHVFLMDFGLARSMEVTQFTQAGTIMGTVEYMSPEQATGEAADRRSDIYTLGLILFEMFTGERPFKSETPMSRLTARLHKPAPDLRVSHPDVPPYVAKIVRRCLERDPALRYQAVDDIIADLDAHTAARRPHHIVRFALTRRYAASALVLLLVLAIGGYVAFGHRRTTASGSGGRTAASTAPRVSLAILPFQNASGDASLDWIGPSLVEMLGTGIGQSSAVHTVSPAHLQQVFRDLHIGADAALDGATVRRVAEFTSADTIVSGRYVKAGDEVRVDATVQDFKRGRTFPLAPVTAPAKDVARVVDAVAGSIRQALAVTPDIIKELRASAFRPSSTSPEAIRSYSEGLQLARQGNYLEAEKRFEDSTRRDPAFALAYSHLGLVLSSLDRDDEAERASRRAVALGEGLPRRERYLILANHARVTNDSQKAIDAYENLAKVSPDDRDVQFTLARLYEDTGALDKARDLYGRVLARDPKDVEALLAAGRVEVKRGNPQAGMDYLNRSLSLAIQLDNDEERGRILQGIGLTYQRLNKPDEALRYYQEALDVRRRLGFASRS
jgi:tetratricopeptide (TPR) repeat protein